MLNKRESEELLVQKVIKRMVKPINPTYAYTNEKGGYNPAFENISQDYFHCPLQCNEIRIFALRSDFILATGTKNVGRSVDHEPFAVFSEKVHKYLDSSDRYGHPSLAVPYPGYDGSVYYAGWLVQREDHLQIHLYSGRFHREETYELVEVYLTKQFINAYGEQKIRFYDTRNYEEFKKVLKHIDLNTAYREYDSQLYEALVDILSKREEHWESFLNGKSDQHEYTILNNLRHFNENANQKNKAKTKMDALLNHIESILYQPSDPFDLEISNRKPEDSKILPYTFYLYWDAYTKEIKYRYNKTSNTIEEKTIDANVLPKEQYDGLKTDLLSSYLHLFSLKLFDKYFPYTLWEEIPDDSEIPSNSLSLFINEKGQLTIAFVGNDGSVKRLALEENAFEIKPANYEYKICKRRPVHCEKNNTFYLYYSGDGLRCLYQDEKNKEQRWVIPKESPFYTMVRKEFEKENQTLRVATYSDAALQAALHIASGVTPTKVDKEKCLKMAIALCLEVAALHDDLKSTTDFMPDYNMYEERWYREQYDIIALKRILLLPASLHARTSLLTEELACELNLTPILDTNTIESCEESMSARTLAAALILAELDFLPIHCKELLLNNEDICEEITEYYEIQSPKLYKSIATLLFYHAEKLEQTKEKVKKKVSVQEVKTTQLQKEFKKLQIDLDECKDDITELKQSKTELEKQVDAQQLEITQLKEQVLSLKKDKITKVSNTTRYSLFEVNPVLDSVKFDDLDKKTPRTNRE